MTEHRRLSAEPERYRFTSDDFRLLDQSGAFEAYSKSELLEGTIYAVHAQFSPHARVHSLFYQAIVRACAISGEAISAWIELTVALSDSDMPQPDIVLTSALPEQGPLPVAQVALVVEIADTSLDFDLSVKAAAYAKAGVPEYWVADVNERVIHRMAEPEGNSYVSRQTVAFGTYIEAATISGLSVSTITL